MAHMLEDLYVPVEVLGCIASHFDAAATLLAFECAASSCRRATADAWRSLTLSRFPRVEDILRLSRMPAPSFRELFRRQIAAALPPPRPSLADFIQRTVGEPLAEAHLPAIEALSRIFSAHAPVSAGDDEEGEEEEPDAAELAEMAARAAAGGSSTLFDDGGLSDEVLASLPLDEPPASWEDAE